MPIWWTTSSTTLGTMLVAASALGICRLSFDEGEDNVRALFPDARLHPADTRTLSLAKAAVEAVEQPSKMPSLPLDVGGTAFQQAVWRALQRIPVGETRTYSEVAAAVGRPSAVRATGTANGQNRVAVLIPCHRVIRSDGGLGGYAYGLDRKRALLNRESSG